MTGGSLAQAKRRSSASSTEAMNPVQINGQSLMLIVPEPNQEELLAEIPRKRTMGLTLGQKAKQVIEPVINNRELILKASQKYNKGSTSKLRNAIPFEMPKSINGAALAKVVILIHSAMKPLMDKMQYTS